jgi:hypothetical protein
MELLLTLAFPFVAALMIYQAFQFGRDIAFEEARRAQRKLLTVWCTELRKLQDENKRLESENTQLKQLTLGAKDA